LCKNKAGLRKTADVIKELLTVTSSLPAFHAYKVDGFVITFKNKIRAFGKVFQILDPGKHILPHYVTKSQNHTFGQIWFGGFKLLPMFCIDTIGNQESYKFVTQRFEFVQRQSPVFHVRLPFFL